MLDTCTQCNVVNGTHVGDVGDTCTQCNVVNSTHVGDVRDRCTYVLIILPHFLG